MQQSPPLGNVSQESLYILWTPKSRYCLQQPKPIDFIPSEIKNPHALPNYIFKILYILSSHLSLCLPICLSPSGLDTKPYFVLKYSVRHVAGILEHMNIVHHYLLRTFQSTAFGRSCSLRAESNIQYAVCVCLNVKEIRKGRLMGESILIMHNLRFFLLVALLSFLCKAHIC
jgi:hypothetical protein